MHLDLMTLGMLAGGLGLFLLAVNMITATQLAAGVAASQLANLLTDHVPIDSLELRIGEGGAPEEVRVGKYVWQDLFLHYGRTLGSDPKDSVGLELRINDQWGVESQMAADGSAGADLVWSIDF